MTSQTQVHARLVLGIINSIYPCHKLGCGESSERCRDRGCDCIESGYCNWTPWRSDLIRYYGAIIAASRMTES